MIVQFCGSKFFSTGLLSIHSSPTLYVCLGLPRSRRRILYLACFTGPGTFVWDSFPLEYQQQHSSWCHLQPCLRVPSIPLSTALTKLLNSTGPDMDPWGTPLSTKNPSLPGMCVAYCASSSIILWNKHLYTISKSKYLEREAYLSLSPENA